MPSHLQKREERHHLPCCGEDGLHRDRIADKGYLSGDVTGKLLRLNPFDSIQKRGIIEDKWMGISKKTQSFGVCWCMWTN
jgi:hypothetical protein